MVASTNIVLTTTNVELREPWLTRVVLPNISFFTVNLLGIGNGLLNRIRVDVIASRTSFHEKQETVEDQAANRTESGYLPKGWGLIMCRLRTPRCTASRQTALVFLMRSGKPYRKAALIPSGAAVRFGLSPPSRQG